MFAHSFICYILVKFTVYLETVLTTMAIIWKYNLKRKHTHTVTLINTWDFFFRAQRPLHLDSVIMSYYLKWVKICPLIWMNEQFHTSYRWDAKQINDAKGYTQSSFSFLAGRSAFASRQYASTSSFGMYMVMGLPFKYIFTYPSSKKINMFSEQQMI